jgi:hypothetical protein
MARQGALSFDGVYYLGMAVDLGLGRILALHHRSATLYQIL